MVRAHAHDNFTLGTVNGENTLLGAIVPSRDKRFLENNGKAIGERSAPTEGRPLGYDRQLALLQDANLPVLLGLNGYAVKFHRDPVGLAQIRKSGPLADTANPCLAELVVADLNYARVYAHGHNLKSLIILRDFGSGNPAPRRVGLAVETKLAGPVEETATASPAFVDELEHAFSANIHQFAVQAALIR